MVQDPAFKPGRHPYNHAGVFYSQEPSASRDVYKRQGLTVLVRPMPGYSGTHVIYATRFGSIDRDFRVDGREVHLPAGVAHFLEHKMFEDEDGDAFAKFAKTGANARSEEHTSELQSQR